MASGNNSKSDQTATPACPDHQLEELDMYCLTCEKPVCVSCLKKTHLRHKWQTMKKLANILRGNGKQLKMEVDSISKSLISGLNTRLTLMKNRAKEDFAQNITTMETARQTWIKYINSVFDDRVATCTLLHDTDINMVEEHKNKLKSTEERLAALLEKIGSDVEYSEFDTVTRNTELVTLLNDLQKLVVIPDKLRYVTRYSGARLPRTACPPLFGSIEHIKVDPSSISATAVNEFICGDTGITNICPVSQNEVWIRSKRKTSIELVNTGAVQRSLDFGCLVYNFAVSDDGTIYFCNASVTKSVNSIDDSGHVAILFTPSPFIPVYVSLTHSNDLLVTLVEEVPKERPGTCRVLVRRMTKSGHKLLEYEYDKDGRTRLFQKPTRAIEHYNGNVCIINKIEDSQKGVKLYGFNSKGDIIFKYNGFNKNFNPLDMCYDVLGNTLVSDTCNHCIHMVSPEGKLVKYLLTQNDVFLPYSIALLDNRIWISKFDTGALKVYEYQSW